MKVKEKLWIFGLEPGADHYGDRYSLAGSNRMTPIEGADYFGAENMLRVERFGVPEPPLDREADKLDLMKKVVWSVNPDNPESVDEVIRVAKYHKNIRGILIETERGHEDLYRRGPEVYKAIADRIHTELGEDFELWLQVYGMKVCALTKPFTDVADVLYICPSEPEETANLDLYMQILDTWVDPKVKRVFGCAFWNFAQRKIMPPLAIRKFLDTYLEWLRAGKIEGISLYGNTLADTKLGAAFEAKRWTDEHREDDI